MRSLRKEKKLPNSPATKGCIHNEYLGVSLGILLSLWASSRAFKDGGGELQNSMEDPSHHPVPENKHIPPHLCLGPPPPRYVLRLTGDVRCTLGSGLWVDGLRHKNLEGGIRGDRHPPRATSSLLEAPLRPHYSHFDIRITLPSPESRYFAILK